MMNKFRQFMYGRYGNDQLNLALVLVGCVITVILSFFDLYPVRLIGTIPYLIALARAFSKNTVKRREENSAFLRFIEPMMKNAAEKHTQMQDKDHRYYKCPGCKKVLRVPRGRGKIKISCPHCSKEFIKKT